MDSQVKIKTSYVWKISIKQILLIFHFGNFLVHSIQGFPKFIQFRLRLIDTSGKVKKICSLIPFEWYG